MLGAFRTSAGIVDRSGRGILHFKGEQAHWFLDQLVTAKVEGLEPGQGAEALLLTPNGRITAVMRLISTGRAVHCDADPGRAQELLEFFQSRIFTTRVEIAERTEEFAMLGVLGPQCDAIVERALAEFVPRESQEDRDLGVSLPGEDEHHTTHFGSAALVRVTRPIRGLELWVRAASAPGIVGLLEKAGAEAASAQDYADLCAVSGLPRFGVDYDDTFLPQEAAMERAVDFSKGCYLGQEAVAMAQRGRVPRRLRRLVFEGEGATGPVVRDGKGVGDATSAAEESGEFLGIAAVSTSVEPRERVAVRSPHGDLPAIVETVPGEVPGPKVPSARELREGLEAPREK